MSLYFGEPRTQIVNVFRNTRNGCLLKLQAIEQNFALRAFPLLVSKSFLSCRTSATRACMPCDSVAVDCPKPDALRNKKQKTKNQERCIFHLSETFAGTAIIGPCLGKPLESCAECRHFPCGLREAGSIQFP